MDNSDRLINDTDASTEIYSKLEIGLDIFLFLLATWSEVGYATFTGSSTSESILDPLKRYLYPSLSPQVASSVTQSLSIASQVFSYADAGLTVATILDVRKKREKFIKEIKNGFRQLGYREINIIPFLFNLSIFTVSFIIISLSPWTGLKMKNFNSDFSLISGITMFFGQMIVLLLQYSSYIFSTPKAILDFFKLEINEKKNILNNIFCTKKGGGLILRSLANATTLGIRFHGISLFTNKLLFGDKALLKVIYSTLAPISVVYRVLTTQTLKDYRETFGVDNNLLQQIAESEASLTEPLPQTENNSNKFKKVLLVLLGCLIGMSFFLRAFSTPVLCTGPIDDPEHNYDIKNTLLACFGLLLGVFASCQYCKFMWGLGKEAVTTVSNHRFFKSANVRNSPSLNNDNQASYGSLPSAGPSRNMLRL